VTAEFGAINHRPLGDDVAVNGIPCGGPDPPQDLNRLQGARSFSTAVTLFLSTFILSMIVR